MSSTDTKKLKITLISVLERKHDDDTYVQMHNYTWNLITINLPITIIISMVTYGILFIVK